MVLELIKDEDPRIMTELEFGGFRGHKKEELPRLQNLQADISSGLVPVYRYPGNYRGDEWKPTNGARFHSRLKSPASTRILRVVDQYMNHCNTKCTYYRNGNDFIDHHFD